MPKPIPISLTAEQMDTVHLEAAARQASIHARHATSNGTTAQPLLSDVLGVMGELAFSTWSGLPWTASRGADYDDQTPDVGNCEVRTRNPKSGRDLVIKASAQTKYPPNRFYILAWAFPETTRVELVGYTTLGTVFDYGTFHERMNAMVFPWQDLADMRFLRDP